MSFLAGNTGGNAVLPQRSANDIAAEAKRIDDARNGEIYRNGVYNNARNSEIASINSSKGRSATILTDAFNNMPSGPGSVL